MKHPIVAHSPLGSDTLRFRAMEGTEALSQLFEFSVELVADSSTLDLQALLGQPLTLAIETTDGNTRYLDGIVARAMLVGREGGVGKGSAREFRYRVIVRPWLWLLTKSRDCKIFQNRTVPDIVQAVMAEYGFPVSARLTGNYRTWTYCVQYQESDFDFVSRLMEHEGIYYYFEHALGSHTLVLSDDIGVHPPLPGADSMPFFAAERVATATLESIDVYEVAEEFAPGAFVTDDYNFTKPRATLKNQRVHPNEHEFGDLEVYEWMGGYGDVNDADHYSRIRLEELQCSKERDSGHAWSRTMAPGYRFKLRNCPRDDANREYLLVEVHYRLRDAGYASTSAGAADAASYECDFVTQPITLPFRPRRHTPRPSTQGPQTAVVVGPPGETIWTDEYGRVKVQFRWDRYGTHDENSSCWLRVVSGAAGSGMGAVNIPRIGQEVVVDFIGGEPDRPIVMGCTYNADMMSAFGLPDQASRSGFVSRTLKGGPDQANSMIFEDKPGAEELALHAEKDYSATVENNKTNKVGNNFAETIGRHAHQAVAGSKQTTIGQDYDHSVAGASRRQVRGSSEQTHGSDYSHTSVGPSKIERQAPHSQSYASSYSHYVAGPGQSTYLAPHVQEHGEKLVHDVASDHGHTVGGSHNHVVNGDHSLDVGGDHRHTVKGTHSRTIGRDHVHTVEGDQVLTVMGNSHHTATNTHTTIASEIHIGGGGGGGIDLSGVNASSDGYPAQVTFNSGKGTMSYIVGIDLATSKIAGTGASSSLDVFKISKSKVAFAITAFELKRGGYKKEELAIELKTADTVSDSAANVWNFFFANVDKFKSLNYDPNGRKPPAGGFDRKAGRNSRPARKQARRARKAAARNTPKGIAKARKLATAQANSRANRKAKKLAKSQAKLAAKRAADKQARQARKQAAKNSPKGIAKAQKLAEAQARNQAKRAAKAAEKQKAADRQAQQLARATRKLDDKAKKEARKAKALARAQAKAQNPPA